MISETQEKGMHHGLPNEAGNEGHSVHLPDPFPSIQVEQLKICPKFEPPYDNR